MTKNAKNSKYPHLSASALGGLLNEFKEKLEKLQQKLNKKQKTSDDKFAENQLKLIENLVGQVEYMISYFFEPAMITGYRGITKANFAIFLTNMVSFFLTMKKESALFKHVEFEVDWSNLTKINPAQLVQLQAKTPDIIYNDLYENLKKSLKNKIEASIKSAKIKTPWGNVELFHKELLQQIENDKVFAEVPSHFKKKLLKITQQALEVIFESKNYTDPFDKQLIIALDSYYHQDQEPHDVPPICHETTYELLLTAFELFGKTPDTLAELLNNLDPTVFELNLLGIGLKHCNMEEEKEENAQEELKKNKKKDYVYEVCFPGLQAPQEEDKKGEATAPTESFSEVYSKKSLIVGEMLAQVRRLMNIYYNNYAETPHVKSEVAKTTLIETFIDGKLNQLLGVQDNKMEGEDEDNDNFLFSQNETLVNNEVVTQEGLEKELIKKKAELAQLKNLEENPADFEKKCVNEAKLHLQQKYAEQSQQSPVMLPSDTDSALLAILVKKKLSLFIKGDPSSSIKGDLSIKITSLKTEEKNLAEKWKKAEEEKHFNIVNDLKKSLDSLQLPNLAFASINHENSLEEQLKQLQEQLEAIPAHQKELEEKNEKALSLQKKANEENQQRTSNPFSTSIYLEDAYLEWQVNDRYETFAAQVTQVLQKIDADTRTLAKQKESLIAEIKSTEYKLAMNSANPEALQKVHESNVEKQIQKDALYKEALQKQSCLEEEKLGFQGKLAEHGNSVQASNQEVEEARACFNALKIGYDTLLQNKALQEAHKENVKTTSRALPKALECLDSSEKIAIASQEMTNYIKEVFADNSIPAKQSAINASPVKQSVINASPVKQSTINVSLDPLQEEKHLLATLKKCKEMMEACTNKDFPFKEVSQYVYEQYKKKYNLGIFDYGFPVLLKLIKLQKSPAEAWGNFFNDPNKYSESINKEKTHLLDYISRRVEVLETALAIQEKLEKMATVYSEVEEKEEALSKLKSEAFVIKNKVSNAEQLALQQADTVTQCKTELDEIAKNVEVLPKLITLLQNTKQVIAKIDTLEQSLKNDSLDDEVVLNFADENSYIRVSVKPKPSLEEIQAELASLKAQQQFADIAQEDLTIQLKKINELTQLAETKFLNVINQTYTQKLASITESNEELSKALSSQSEHFKNLDPLALHQAMNPHVVQWAEALNNINAFKEEIKQANSEAEKLTGMPLPIAESLAKELASREKQLTSNLQHFFANFNANIKSYSTELGTLFNNDDKESKVQLNENEGILNKWGVFSGENLKDLELPLKNNIFLSLGLQQCQQNYDKLQETVANKRAIHQALADRITARGNIVTETNRELEAYLASASKSKARKDFIKNLEEQLGNYAETGDSESILQSIENANFSGYGLSSLLNRLKIRIRDLDEEIPAQYNTPIKKEEDSRFTREAALAVLKGNVKRIRSMNILYNEIDKLKEYSKMFYKPEGLNANPEQPLNDSQQHGKTALELADALETRMNRFIIKNAGKNITEEQLNTFKSTFLAHLHSQDDKMSQYKTWAPIIANIALAFTAVMTLFLPVVAGRFVHNYVENRKFTFFYASSGLNRVHAIERGLAKVNKEDVTTKKPHLQEPVAAAAENSSLNAGSLNNASSNKRS